MILSKRQPVTNLIRLISTGASLNCTIISFLDLSHAALPDPTNGLICPMNNLSTSSIRHSWHVLTLTKHVNPGIVLFPYLTFTLRSSVPSALYGYLSSIFPSHNFAINALVVHAFIATTTAKPRSNSLRVSSALLGIFFQSVFASVAALTNRNTNLLKAVGDMPPIVLARHALEAVHSLLYVTS